MQMTMLIPCVALLVAAAPALSNPPSVARQIAPSEEQLVVNPPAGGGASNKAIAPQEKKICRQLPSSSSRLPNRACLTEKEWQQVEDDLSH